MLVYDRNQTDIVNQSSIKNNNTFLKKRKKSGVGGFQMSIAFSDWVRVAATHPVKVSTNTRRYLIIRAFR